jgi:hypothetical protein
MKKCGSCNGSLKEDETVCYQCEMPVPPAHATVSIRERFRTVIKVVFIVSAVMTVASLFFDFTPSFAKCTFATAILGLVKSSADQMSENK